MKEVILVTGTSSGLGKAFAEALLRSGYVVVGTVREPEAALRFESIQPGESPARVLDVTDAPTKIAAVVKEFERNVSPIYALINNAGYGHEGTLEQNPMD